MTKLLSLQASWRYYKRDGLIELSSVLTRDRFRLGGPPSENMEKLLYALIEGVPTEVALAELSKISLIEYETVRKILNALQERGALVVVEGRYLGHEVDVLYDRQIRFFNNYETDSHSGFDYNQSLQNKRILIIGLGGYGSWLTLLFSRLGVKNIVGIDPDIVESTNLNRQVIYTKDHIGKLKIDACKEAVSLFDQSVTFTGHAVYIKSPDDLEPYLSGVDLVLNTFGYAPIDHPAGELSRNIAIAAYRKGVPSLAFTGSWIGTLNIPGETACYGCVVTNPKLEPVISASVPLVHRRYEPNFVPRIGLAPVIASWEASRFLAGIERTPTLDGVITLDTFTYKHQRVSEVDINTNCPICLGGKREHEVYHQRYSS